MITIQVQVQVLLNTSIIKYKYYHKNWWDNNRWCWKFRFSQPIYNLIKYSSNYFETTGSLWFYSKDEASNLNNNIENTEVFQVQG